MPQKDDPKKDKTKNLKIEITNIENIKPAYSNYLQITHSPHEFVISFCYIDQAKLKKGDSPKVPAECFSRIVVSPSFLPNIIEALKINLEKYNKNIQKEIDKIKKRGKK